MGPNVTNEVSSHTELSANKPRWWSPKVLLAFIVAAGWVVAAIAIALTVLRSESAAAAEVEAQSEVEAQPAYSEAA
jgi:hypothetical protein